MRKLVQALPETFRADAEAAAVGRRARPRRLGRHRAPRPAHLDALQRAVVDGVQVRLAYADRTRSETERVVHPLGLVEKDCVWYLVADTANGMRTFRVNRVRIGRAPPTSRSCGRAGFDLATTWESVVATIEERRTSQRAVVVRIATGATTACGPSSARAPRSLRTLDDGRVEVEVGAPTTTLLAEQLAGWGALIEVVEPAEVRDRAGPHRARARRALRCGGRR